MREIKFRALDNLGAWIYGIPQTSSTLHLTLDCMAQYFTEQRKYGRQNVIVKPQTLGQFTGLKDKNGKEIYEGDIIGDWVELDGKQEQSKQTVFWHESEGQWMLDYSFSQDRSHFFSLASDLRDFEYEVVGNIHENPELCK